MAQVTFEFAQDPLVRLYLFHASLLALKMLFMSPYTASKRMRTKTFANPEDAQSSILKLKAKVGVNEAVERVRRAHLNDLENIPIFLIISIGYLLTNPGYGAAQLLFRVYTFARFAHTFVYAVVVVPQPSRAICWVTGFIITLYMAFKTLLYFW